MVEGTKRSKAETNVERAERLRPYYALQLAFAEEVSKRLGFALGESLFRFTNIHQQMGLGWASDATSLHSSWNEFVNKMSRITSSFDRLQCIVDAVARAKPERQTKPERYFGCFYFDFDIDAPVKTVRIHFHNNDKSKKGPLSTARLAERRRDLSEMFEYIQRSHPDVVAVSGRSWLYTREEYRRLFPPQYVNSMKLGSDHDTFSGTSRWGQFLTSEGGINRKLADEFIKKIKALNVHALGNAFPLKTFKLNAPIATFYAYYGLDEQT